MSAADIREREHAEFMAEQERDEERAPPPWDAQPGAGQAVWQLALPRCWPADGTRAPAQAFAG